MNALTKLSGLPLEVSSKVLEKYAVPGEMVVCLQLGSVGNFSPFRVRGRTNRTYRFEWDRGTTCHVLRVPASVWMLEKGAMAKDVFSQVMMRPVVPMLEVADGATGNLGGNGPVVVVAEKPEAGSQKPENETSLSGARKTKAVARKKAAA